MKFRTKVLIIAGALYLLLFFVRFGFELSSQSGDSPRVQVTGGFNEFMEQRQVEYAAPSAMRKNYATAKFVIQQPDAPAQTVDQKYERVASVVSSSTAFEEDRARVIAAAEGLKAVVQREQAYGLEGSRSLELSFGVVPDLFDKAVEGFRAIGKIDSISVTKTDKTAEFQALEARRRSLEASRDGLKALRRAGAALADLVALEGRILELEGQIQELGVSLGDFREENSLCTVNVTLSETRPVNWAGRIFAALLEALAWTTGVYAGIVFAALCVAGLAALGLFVYGKIQTFFPGAKPEKK